MAALQPKDRALGITVATAQTLCSSSGKSEATRRAATCLCGPHHSPRLGPPPLLAYGSEQLAHQKGGAPVSVAMGAQPASLLLGLQHTLGL